MSKSVLLRSVAAAALLGLVAGLFALTAYAAVDAPTNVGLRVIKATPLKGRLKGTVQVKWTTATEVGVLGYTVYRERGKVRTKVNKALVVALGGARGGTYSVRDKLPKTLKGKLTYRLQGLGEDGSKAFIGSAKVTIK